MGREERNKGKKEMDWIKRGERNGNDDVRE